MRAAIAALRQLGPTRIVVAVPVASPETCQQIGGVNQLVGRAFYTYRFSVAPNVSLFGNTLQLHALADAAYGMTNFETNASGHSYDNSYLSRCECDPFFVAADRLGGFVPSNDRIHRSLGHISPPLLGPHHHRLIIGSGHGFGHAARHTKRK